MSQTDSKYQRIHQTVAGIPVGRVASYGLVADLAGMPGRARLVGRALRAAPSDLALPWHRVLRSDGRIAFESGGAASREQILRLSQEGVEVVDQRVDMRRFGWRPSLDELLAMDY